jgi:hypothetical protein
MKKSSKIQEEDKLLLRSAELASSKAVRSSFALGLTVKYIENDLIVEVNSHGKNILRKKHVITNFDLSKLKKGIVLERK